MLLLALHVPVTRLHRHGVGLSTPEKSAGSLLETQVVNAWVLTREDPCLANCSSSTAPAVGVALPVRRHQGGIDTAEVLRNLSDSGLALTCRWWKNAVSGIDGRDRQASVDREAGGRLWFIQKKTAAGTVEPVGGPCPSKEVWETLR